MATGADRYEEVCDDLTARHPGIERAEMMGMPSVKRDGGGRPFKEWAVVPPAHADRWPDLAERAVG